MIRKFIYSVPGQLFTALVALAIVSACSLDAKSDVSSGMQLTGTQWNLKTLAGNTVISERPLNVSFEDNRINGFAGCNRFFTSYTQGADGSFSIGSIGATKMACGPERDALEQQFLTQLANIKQFSISRDQLYLLDAERKIVMSFTMDKKAVG